MMPSPIRDIEDDREAPHEYRPYLSDDEEDIIHMEQTGQISAEAARLALEQIGALNTDITY